MHCTVYGFAKSRTQLSDFHFCKILNIVPCAIQVGPFCLTIIYSNLYLLGFPCDSAGKESAHNAGDLGSIPGLGRSLGEGKDTHSSILAWRIPWTLQSMESQTVGHD